MKIIKYKELSQNDMESLALILTENGHAEDMEISFNELSNGTGEIMIRIIPERQQKTLQSWKITKT